MPLRLFCDSCKNQIGTDIEGSTYYGYGSTNGNCCECKQGQSYHPTCLETIFKKKYCPTHAIRGRNSQIIADYAKKMWDDVGFAGEVNDDGHVAAKIGPLDINIQPDYDKNEENLTKLTLVVAGLAEKDRKFAANIHTHDDVVKQLQGAIVRSLRSTKSSLTIQKKKMDEKVMELDTIIGQVMDRLGGILPPLDDDFRSTKKKEKQQEEEPF